MTLTDQPTTDTDWRAQVRGSRFGTVAVLVVTLVAVLVGAWLVKGPAAQEQAATADSAKISAVELKGDQGGPAPEVGKPAPAVTGTSYDGTAVSLAAYKGRPVWLTFGASWCASCRAEFPDIKAAADAAKPGGLAVVGVNLSEGAPAVKEYAQRLGLTYPQIPDPDTRIASAYRVMGVPAHVFIDKDGVVRSIDMGILGPEQLRDRLAAIGA